MLPIQKEFVSKVAIHRAIMMKSLIERDDIITILHVAMLANKNIYLIGPGGEGKSLIASLFAKLFDMSYFEYQLHSFSKIDDWEGPTDVKEFQNGVLKRKTANFSPNAEIILADELPRGQALLSCMYKLLNEGTYYVDGKIEKAKRKLLIAGSNHMLPAEHDALFDRFPFFMECNMISNDAIYDLYMSDEPVIVINDEDKLNGKTLELAQSEMKSIPNSDYIAKTMQSINAQLKLEKIHISTRLNRWCNLLMKANAYCEGRDEMIDDDVWMLRNVLARTNKDRAKVAEILRKHVNQELDVILTTYDKCVEFYSNWESSGCPITSPENNSKDSHTCIKEMFKEIENIKPKAINQAEHKRVTKSANELVIQIAKSQINKQKIGKV